ncbi:MAG: CRISPR-associated helicase Cas3' [Gammaproteobacteria bacterium]|nr:CRISPR-associated helicase Cas3' [Gammaproteobacteria bacterium]
MLGRRGKGRAEVEPVPFEKCPAKTFRDGTGRILRGRTVLNHCQIVGEVARALLARMPKEMTTELFPRSSALVAAAHDIGKVSPYFVEKIRRNCTNGIAEISPMPHLNPALERGWGGHAGVSQVTAKALALPGYIPEILGQHHGYSPPISGLRANDENFGGDVWQTQRERLVDALKIALEIDEWPKLTSVAQARLLAGLTSVADWIGSGEFFEDPKYDWQSQIEPALDAAGFVPLKIKQGVCFEQIFDFSARDAQRQLIEMVNGPGVYVLEAPMGLGKTEAALYAAYRMLEQEKASGIYFALPTQLTSNKIHERFSTFLQGILEQGQATRALLLHGGAWLQETEMGEEGRPGGAWFSHAKRGLLAPFSVGTIDQALMAAMNVKHGFVRAFGLAGKVVILDEVHTYDAYTGTILDALVNLLRELHCTVIILSATLNRERRQQLMGSKVEEDGYPLITAMPNDEKLVEVPIPVDEGQDVRVSLIQQEDLAIQQALLRADQGQQVLWVENTVNEAQQRYLDLAARCQEIGVACGLLHSRFTVLDRQTIESQWVNLFGKQGWSERIAQGRILVGTQVLEQSLDIDADFLVSRFAPTDMLFQRLGRLWRHQDTPRPSASLCEAWIIAPDLVAAIETPTKSFGSTAYVYSPYVLCRSLEVWQDRQELVLPQDIRPMIEQTYQPRDESGSMRTWLEELEHGTRWRKGRQAMRQLARITLSEKGNTLPESKAQTRHSEMESIDVLLLRSIRHEPEVRCTRLTLLEGETLQLPWDQHRLSKAEWRQLSARLMRQLVSVSVNNAPQALPIDMLRKIGLHHCFYLGRPEMDEAILRVALVDETDRLKGVQGASVHDKDILEYRGDIGYRVIKHQGQC